MNTRSLFLSVILLFQISYSAHAQVTPPNADFYRNFSMKVRKTGSFKVPTPGTSNFEYRYSLEQDQPLSPQFSKPLLSDLAVYSGSSGFFRNFWDKIILKDGSYIELSGEKVPLTCIFISGQDNRFIGEKNPLFPEFLIRVYIVANDFGCTGPINPNWPASGTRKETWDTYLYYEVRDPTIMLPTEATLRYRWAEYPSVLMDGGM